jgi:hypothetical protein
MALRICPDSRSDAMDAISLMPGDDLFIAPPTGAYRRTEVLQASDAEATFRDSDGGCWRMHRGTEGEATANVQLVGVFEDWIVESAVAESRMAANRPS